MKKLFILLILITAIGYGARIQALEGIIKVTWDTDLLEASVYQGGVSEPKTIETKNQATTPPDEYNDYNYTISLSFDVHPYMEYLILPEINKDIDFFNDNYGDASFLVHFDKNKIGNERFYKQNKTISFISYQDHITPLSESNDFSAWRNMFGDSRSIVHNGKEYSLDNAVIGQSQAMNKVSFFTLTTEKNKGSSFIYCRLYTSSCKNATYFGKDPYILTSSSSPLKPETLLSLLKASDDYDKDITGNMVLESTNYVLDNQKIAPGVYYFTVAVNDSTGNKTRQKFFIHALDYTKPVITGKNYYEIDVQYSLTLQALQSALQATDDMGGTLSDFYVIEDTYSKNMKVLGEHRVIFGIQDSSGNEGRYEVKINVKDTTAPMIYINRHPYQIYGNPALTKEEILSGISSIDNYDRDVELSLAGYEEYVKNYQTLGSYTISVIAKDDYGNISTKELQLPVIDTKSPTIELVDGIPTILMGEGQVPTREELLALISQQSNRSVKEVRSSYFEETTPNGDYIVIVTFDNGEETEYKLNIQSLAEEAKISVEPLVIALSIIAILGGIVVGKLSFDYFKKRKKSSLVKR